MNSTVLFIIAAAAIAAALSLLWSVARGKRRLAERKQRRVPPDAIEPSSPPSTRSPRQGRDDLDPLSLGQPDAVILPRADTGSVEFSEVPVLYATDRAPVHVDGTMPDFNAERGEGLTFGVARVSIPRRHRRGCIERPSWWKLEFSEDPRKHIVVRDVLTMAEEAFVTRLGEALRDQPRREAFLFVHGFNVSFTHACRRVAQVAYDLQHFVPVLFSWPSRGQVVDYVADSTAVKWCEPHLRHVVQLLLAHTELHRLHVIGHSMGTQAVAAVVRDLVGDDRVREIVLAAADIDRQTFEEQIAPAFSLGRPRATVYVSEVDQALQLSKSLNRGYERLGDCEGGVSILPGIDTIDATAVADSLLNHSTVFDVRTMVEDLHRLLADGTPAERRPLLPKQSAGKRYWAVAP